MWEYVSNILVTVISKDKVNERRVLEHNASSMNKSYEMPLLESMVIEPDINSRMKTNNPWSVSDASGRISIDMKQLSVIQEPKPANQW